MKMKTQHSKICSMELKQYSREMCSTKHNFSRKKKSQNLCFHSMKLEKEKQTKPKASKRKK